MYRHWEDQKKKIFEVITGGQSATCQVCYGTNYSIFFRNIHSDLLLKRTVVPVYVDLNHLNDVTVQSFYNLVVNSIKRNLVEKKLVSKFDPVSLTTEEAKSAIEAEISELVSKKHSVVFFVEETDKILHLEPEVFEVFEKLDNTHDKFSIIYLFKKSAANLSPHLTQNVIYMNVRDQKSMRSLERGITQHMFNTIYELTGGIDRFHGVAIDLKNNLPPRKRKDLRDLILENWHLKNEVKKLWDGFSETEIELLTQIVWGVKDFDKSYDKDLSHLLNLGLIQKSKTGYKIVVGMLRIIGSERAKETLKNVKVSKKGVVINGNKVVLKLSVGETKVLTKLVTNKNKIVGKRDIAKTMGSRKIGSEDILVTQTMEKLKNKLSSVWVNPQNFVTVEGRGVIYKE